MNKSIITNWGCKQNCWFCIWKHHPLKDIQLDTDWQKLGKFIKNEQKISISGGGDCLFEYNKHIEWWNKLFSVFNGKIDIHTKQRFYNDNFWKLINKVVVSSNKLYEDKDYLLYLRNFCQVRIVHVVTEYTEINDIEDYVKFCSNFDMQFTLKQLSIYDDKGMYKKLKLYYKNLYFLDEGDYNLYFMPNNEIWSNFMKNKEMS